MLDVAFFFTVLATALNGIAAGATLDQAIKQLPTRHRLGVIAYSTYSKAADLGNGLPWYISLGVSAVALTAAAAITVAFQQQSTSTAFPLYLAVALSICHSLVTSQAAPTLFSQRQHENDQAALTKIFMRFSRLNALRAALQVLTFGTLLWALISFER